MTSSAKSNLVFMALICLTVLLGIVNRWIGCEITFSIFYWVPILLAAWFLGPKRAAVIAVMSAMFWFHADTSDGHVYSHYLILIWKASMRFAMFIAIIFFSYQLKKELHNERELGRKDSLTGLFNFRYLSEAMLRFGVMKNSQMTHLGRLAKTARSFFGFHEKPFLECSLSGCACGYNV